MADPHRLDVREVRVTPLDSEGAPSGPTVTYLIRTLEPVGRVRRIIAAQRRRRHR